MLFRPNLDVNHAVGNGKALLGRLGPLANALAPALFALGLALRGRGGARRAGLASIVKVALA